MAKSGQTFTVIVSPKAKQMLVEHASFLARVSEKAARTLVADFRKQTKSLEQFPERNSFFDSGIIPAGKYRKMVFSGRYLLIYQIIERAVLIEYVIDCRKDYQWLLSGAGI